MHQNSTPMNSRGQAYLVTLAKGLSTSSKDFFSDAKMPISFKFHMQSTSKTGKKVYKFGPAHMTKMAAMSTYSKSLKKSSSIEPLSRFP